MEPYGALSIDTKQSHGALWSPMIEKDFSWSPTGDYEQKYFLAEPYGTLWTKKSCGALWSPMKKTISHEALWSFLNKNILGLEFRVLR